VDWAIVSLIALFAAGGVGCASRRDRRSALSLFVRRPGIDRVIPHRLKYKDFWQAAHDLEPNEKRTAWVFIHL
jgi:hypothetical protein